LEQAVRVGRAFEPFSDDEKRALLRRTKRAGAEGKLEAFKTSERFDGTARNPHWLTGGEI
jgi:hypothetical protein